MTTTEGEGLSDAELVSRFRVDRAARSFEALYERHSPYLLRVAARMLDGDRASAEDALQEAWLRAATSFERFRGDSSLRTWLCGITVNCCREQWRRRRFSPLAGVDVLGTASAPAPSALAGIRLQRALQLLDEPSREAIELFDVLGHSHEEIAQILGVAVGTSKSRLSRARETLRGLLGTPED